MTEYATCEDKRIVEDYFLHEGLIEYSSEEDYKDRANRLMHYVKVLQGIEILNLIKERENDLCEITTRNIPQFSDIQSIDKVLSIVESTVDDTLAYRKIGYFFNKDASEGAQHKYGENHYKLASSIGLVTNEKPYGVTPLYYAYLLNERSVRKEIVGKLLLNIPIIQRIMIGAEKGRYNVPNLLYTYLSKSTARRRGSSIKQVLRTIYDIMPEDEKIVMNTNIEWSY